MGDDGPIITLKDEKIKRAKERLDRASASYAAAQSEFIKAKREYNDAWTDILREFE